jgi:hypothetical protein
MVHCPAQIEVDPPRPIGGTLVVQPGHDGLRIALTGAAVVPDGFALHVAGAPHGEPVPPIVTGAAVRAEIATGEAFREDLFRDAQLRLTTAGGPGLTIPLPAGVAAGPGRPRAREEQRPLPVAPVGSPAEPVAHWSRVRYALGPLGAGRTGGLTFHRRGASHEAELVLAGKTADALPSAADLVIRDAGGRQVVRQQVVKLSTDEGGARLTTRFRLDPAVNRRLCEWVHVHLILVDRAGVSRFVMIVPASVVLPPPDTNRDE